MKYSTSFSTSRRGYLMGVAAISLGAIGAGVVSAAAPTPGQKASITRSSALLAATQKELAGSDNSVDAITLAQEADGAQIYLLSGPNTVCLLSAWPEDADGKSRGLACGRPAIAPTDHLLSDEFRGKSGRVITAVAIADTNPLVLAAKAERGTRLTVVRAGGVATVVDANGATFQATVNGEVQDVAGVTAAQRKAMADEVQALVDTANREQRESDSDSPATR